MSAPAHPEDDAKVVSLTSPWDTVVIPGRLQVAVAGAGPAPTLSPTPKGLRRTRARVMPAQEAGTPAPVSADSSQVNRS